MYEADLNRAVIESQNKFNKKDVHMFENICEGKVCANSLNITDRFVSMQLGSKVEDFTCDCVKESQIKGDVLNTVRMNRTSVSTTMNTAKVNNDETRIVDFDNLKETDLNHRISEDCNRNNNIPYFDLYDINNTKYNLRPIVIDGSNVALSHGNNMFFSCKGIRICVDWFKERGHKEIKAFVPNWRKENSRAKHPIQDQEILFQLERENILVFTPSRWVCGRRVVCYDDRYILKYAAAIDGVIVSNDNYRDLVAECDQFKKIVGESILMYSFVEDRFMPPDDPFGRNGPSLDLYLKKEKHPKNLSPMCPYGKKCTYGHKCKYSHNNLSFEKQLSSEKASPLKDRIPKQLACKALSAPLDFEFDSTHVEKPLTRTRSNDLERQMFNNSSLNINSHRKHEQDISHDRNQLGSRNSDSEESINRHKKLQRITQANVKAIKHTITNSDVSRNNSPIKVTTTTCLHKPLKTAVSAPTSSQSPKLQVNHKNLSRMSSAPSEVYCGKTKTGKENDMIKQKREWLRFHLTNIFPREQVDKAFEIHLKETDPNILCGTILKLNSKSKLINEEKTE